MTGESVTFGMLLETRCQQQLKKVHSGDEDLNRMEKELDSVQNVGVTVNAVQQRFKNKEKPVVFLRMSALIKRGTF